MHRGYRRMAKGVPTKFSPAFHPKFPDFDSHPAFTRQAIVTLSNGL
jgi:hypothetical protein